MSDEETFTAEPKVTAFEGRKYTGTNGSAIGVIKWVSEWRPADATWSFSIAEDDPEGLIFWPSGELPGRIPAGWSVLRGPDDHAAVISPEKLSEIFNVYGR
jgi:hypothetical protein